MSDKKLRIIQSVSVRWYNACAYYGVSLAKALRDAGHDVTLAAPVLSPAHEKAKNLDLSILDLPGTGSKNPAAYLRIAKVCRTYAKDQSIDIVNAINGNDHTFWTGALVGTDIPLVRTFCNRIMKRVNPGKRLLMRRTAGVLASCLPLRNRCAELYNLNHDAIPVINGGVDTIRFAPGGISTDVRSSFGIPPDAVVFGIIGRFSPVKGHETFFKAASSLIRSTAEVHFLVSGGQAQLSREDILNMINDNGIADHTTVLDKRDDVRELISACDVGVVASLGSEVICRIAMEYQAMGLPVIAADTNVLPEVIVHENTGLVFPAGDSEMLYKAMQALCSNRDYRLQLGIQAREHAVKRFSYEAFATMTAEAYSHIIV